MDETRIAQELIEIAASAARNRRDGMMPKREGKTVVAWGDLPEDVRDRWREAMIAARDALGLDEMWQTAAR